MKIIDFFRDILQPGRTYYLNRRLLNDGDKLKLDLEDFSMQMASDIIAGMIAKCEFKTYVNGAETKGDEYYLWNVEPNVNQNSSQFLQRLIYKLLHDNEALVIAPNGQLLVADSFSVKGYAMLPSTFSDVAVQTFDDNFPFDRTFDMSEVLYFRLNDRNIRLPLESVMGGYSKLLSMAMEKYKHAGGRKGTLKLDKPLSGDKTYEKEVNEYVSSQFGPYFRKRDAVLPLPRGMDYTEITGEGSKKSTSEVADITSLTKEAISRTAQALRIPPALLVGDVAEISSLMDGLLTACIDPLVDLLQAEINRKRYGKKAYLSGTYLKIDTTRVKHVDVFDSANSADKLLADGIYNVDELRVKLGDAPLGTKASKQYVRTKNYQSVDTPENGGDNNAKQD